MKPFHEHPTLARPSPTHTLGLPCKAPLTGSGTAPVLLFNVRPPTRLDPRRAHPDCPLPHSIKHSINIYWINKQKKETLDHRLLEARY